jgi:hypothetical protein
MVLFSKTTEAGIRPGKAILIDENGKIIELVQWQRMFSATNKQEACNRLFMSFKPMDTYHFTGLTVSSGDPR